ncbi:hypothetical protein SDC9_201718 [bioreactor metagenome]|uniref:Uncharacterized protein n=1 Tax=bioreactor metagenome TaxID=1076179 RepID=A0A645IUG3_9ZZZZ
MSKREYWLDFTCVTNEAREYGFDPSVYITRFCGNIRMLVWEYSIYADILYGVEESLRLVLRNSKYELAIRSFSSEKTSSEPDTTTLLK